jgi:hypothetical protein
MMPNKGRHMKANFAHGFTPAAPHTREPLKTNRSRLFAAATITAAGALLTCPALAQARPMFPLAPPCGNWEFSGGYVLIGESTTGFSTRFDTAPTPSTSVAGTAADGTDKKGGAHHGTAHGGISGRHIDVTVNWDNGTYQGYVGDVTDETHANGRTQNNHPDQSNIPWATQSTAFKCADAPAAQPGPVQKQDPAQKQDPHPQASTPTARVTRDTDLYDKSNDNRDAKIIGHLKAGQTVKVNAACTPNAWCTLTEPAGAAWGRDLTNN